MTAKLNWKKIFKMRKLPLILAIILMIAENILNIFLPRLIGFIIDLLSQSSMTLPSLKWHVALYLSIVIIGYLLSITWLTNLFVSGLRIVRNLNNKIFNYILDRNSKPNETNNIGKISTLIHSDIPEVGNTISLGLLTLTETVIGITVTALAMSMWISIKLTVISLIPIFIFMILSAFLNSLVYKSTYQSKQKEDKLNHLIQQSLKGIRVIRIFSQESNAIERINHVANEFVKAQVKKSVFSSLYHPLVHLFTGCSKLLALAYGSFLIFNNTISLGDLVAFSIYIGMLTWPILSATDFMNFFYSGKASLDRINEVLKDSSHPLLHDQDSNFQKNLPYIQLNSLHYRPHNKQNYLIKNLSIHIKRGELIGVVGPSGSGKSTLLHLILRDLIASSGSISYGGISAKNLSIAQIHHWTGYVPQKHMLISGTIKDNILFGQSNFTPKQLNQISSLVTLDKDLANMADGFETFIGEDGGKLSGGQKQKVALARALFKNPVLLLIDDALSSIDEYNRDIILENLKQNYNRVTIITSNRLSTVSKADHIIVMSYEEQPVIGTHKELLEKNTWYRKQYEYEHIKSLLTTKNY